MPQRKLLQWISHQISSVFRPRYHLAISCGFYKARWDLVDKERRRSSNQSGRGDCRIYNFIRFSFCVVSFNRLWLWRRVDLGARTAHFKLHPIISRDKAPMNQSRCHVSTLEEKNMPHSFTFNGIDGAPTLGTLCFSCVISRTRVQTSRINWHRY